MPRNYRRTGMHAPGSGPVLELFVDRLVDCRAAVHRVSEAQVHICVVRADQVVQTVLELMARIDPVAR